MIDMQKKYSFLIIVSLAVISTVIFVGGSRMGGFLMNRMYDTGSDAGMGGYSFMGGVETAPAQDMGVPEPMMAKLDSSVSMMPPYYYEDNALDVNGRLYEKSSYHSVVVKDVSKYVQSIKEYFLSINAVILSSSKSSSGKYETAYLNVKVPVDKFDEVTSRVTQDVKKVIDESVDAYDITGQAVSTQDNVTALQEQKSLLEAQMKDLKTETEKAKLQIEINRIDRQIENAKKAAENVDARVRYASVSLSVSDNEKSFNPGVYGDFSYELDRAWQSLGGFIKLLGVFAIWMVVYSIIWIPVAFIIRQIVKRFKK